MRPINLPAPRCITDPPDGFVARKTLGMSLAFKNLANGDAEICIYGGIGESDGPNPTSVARLLRDSPQQPVLVRINSPGGNAFDGITIYNQLVAHKGYVTAMIEGIAGSAASIVAMAGDVIKIYENASLFIHRASATIIGNAETVQEGLQWLNQIDQQIAMTYSARTGRPSGEMLELMIGRLDGTTMDSSESLRRRFVDEVVPMVRPSKIRSQPKKTAASRDVPFMSNAEFSRWRQNVLDGNINAAQATADEAQGRRQRRSWR